MNRVNIVILIASLINELTEYEPIDENLSLSIDSDLVFC